MHVPALVLPNTRVRVSQKPRYSDGDLTLTYLGGDECSSGFQRMSVISFECNETAGECAPGSSAPWWWARGFLGVQC